jgi:large subunit ribosomal protein L24
MAWTLSIRKGDQVKVIAGRDKGKTGRVLSVDPGKYICTVEHVNLLKRHTRPNPAKQIKGGIVEREGAIQVSNVQLLCPSCNKPTRVGHKVEWESVQVERKDGRVVERKKVKFKYRSCRRCGATLDH